MATAPLGNEELHDEVQRLRKRLAETEAQLSSVRQSNVEPTVACLSETAELAHAEAGTPHRAVHESLQQEFACSGNDETITNLRGQIVELLASNAELQKNLHSLQLRAEELQTLLDTIPLGIFIANDIYCHSMTGNKTLRNFLRVSANQNVSHTAPRNERPKNYRIFCNGIEVPGEELPAQRAARGGPACFDEIEVIFDDGTSKEALVFAAPLFDADGKPRGSVGGLLDITERKQIEDRLRLMNERFQVALKGSNIMVFNQDLQLRYTWVHDPILGTNTERFLGKRDSDFFQRTEDALRTESIKRRVIETGVSQHHEVCVQVDGTERFFDLRVDPTYSSDGAINGITCAAIDVTDRKRIETSLKESDRRKNEFLATLAHELRNPLAPLCNGLQLLELARGEAGTIDEVRTMMARQLSQLVRLVDDLLDLSRISQGKITLELRPTNLEDVIRSAIETSKPLIDEMCHTISLSLPGESVYVNADFTRLAQVFVNLLNNAAKYSERSSSIELSAKAADRQVIIEILDKGIGINPTELQRVFEMFSQVDDSQARSKGGLGIGLSLVKRLVEMHGGRVEAHSEGIGCGSKFSVWLPVTCSNSDTQPVRQSQSSKIVFRILVVDDNRDNANTLAIVLKANGHRVHAAYDGEQALTCYKEFAPDIILLDIGLPKVDGHGVCKTIRQELADNRVVIIAQSGWGQAQDLKRSEESGFDDHLVKPIDLRSLFEVMKKHWTSRRQ